MGVNINNTASNMFSAVLNEVQANRATGQTILDNLIGTMKTSITNMFDGGFAGLDQKNYSTLEAAIEKYVDDIQAIISGFNADSAGAEVAYKGDVKVAVDEFIVSIKKILEAYVSTMRMEITESRGAFIRWTQETRNVAAGVSQNASDISKAAETISLD